MMICMTACIGDPIWITKINFLWRFIIFTRTENPQSSMPKILEIAKLHIFWWVSQILSGQGLVGRARLNIFSLEICDFHTNRKAAKLNSKKSSKFLIFFFKYFSSNSTTFNVWNQSFNNKGQINIGARVPGVTFFIYSYIIDHFSDRAIQEVK